MAINRSVSHDDDKRLSGPIRTYAQVVEAMRKKGDKTISINACWYYERQAFKKLRKALKEYAP